MIKGSPHAIVERFPPAASFCVGTMEIWRAAKKVLEPQSNATKASGATSSETCRATTCGWSGNFELVSIRCNAWFHPPILARICSRKVRSAFDSRSGSKSVRVRRTSPTIATSTATRNPMCVAHGRFGQCEPVPITAMLIGIVLRGSAFVFRKYDSTEDAVQRRWSTIFGIASFFTPFFQGLTLGALTTGNIHLVGDQVTTGFFAGWLTPFALTCGLFALALFAFVAATYMAVETQSEPDLQNDFRLRAIWAEATLIPLATLVFIASKNGAPFMHRGLTNWWAPLLL